MEKSGLKKRKRSGRPLRNHWRFEKGVQVRTTADASSLHQQFVDGLRGTLGLAPLYASDPTHEVGEQGAVWNTGDLMHLEDGHSFSDRTMDPRAANERSVRKAEQAKERRAKNG